MKTMAISGVDVAQGRVVKALEAMLDGASDEQLREMKCGKWDEQFYYIRSEIMPCTYMIKKEFNCLIVWFTYGGPTSFNGGDEVVCNCYHPLCILNKTRGDEYQDVCRDIVNGLVRIRAIGDGEYCNPKEEV